ncbi:MAG: hypothetical protein II072_01870, partial [Clostridia bacterium]|nr:hypothetical protein [Clostridia bacterium]
TSAEHANAVWVKNEWSRFLALMRKDRSKLLLPCYKGMDPYDLPEQLSVLQSYDMSKIGFMQDLIRGIKKVLAKDEPKEQVKETVIVQQNAAAASVAPLLKRAFMYLEDGAWQNADEYAEKVLDQDPENAEAYVAKLMSELKVKHREEIKNEQHPLDMSGNYQKAVRFGSDALKSELTDYSTRASERYKNNRYGEAVRMIKEATEAIDYREAADTLKSIKGWKDADALAAQCLEKAEACRKDALYTKAAEMMDAAETEDAYRKAADAFRKIPGWKDADALTAQCMEKAEAYRKDELYTKATEMINGSMPEEDYRKAAEIFRKIPGWKDADALAAQCIEKAEEERIKPQEVMRALKEEADRSSDLSAEDKLAAANIRVGYLERILNSFDSAQAQLNALQTELDALISQEKQLNDQRSRLGVFAGKEKKRIDEELAAVSAKKSDLAARISQDQKALGNYSSAQDVERDLSEARRNAAELKAQIESTGRRYSFDEALRIYLGEPRVSAKVNASLYPAMAAESVAFGRYIQKKNGKPEAIEWQVLARENGRVLVISEYALDCLQYHTSKDAVTWETCSLRKWLNGTFLNTAFSEKERAMIPTVTVSADITPGHKNTNPGNDTMDKVFLLSVVEFEKYFSGFSARLCRGTEYCFAQGANKHDYGLCKWWLRSPGKSSDTAASVSNNGSIDTIFWVNLNRLAVRPAMWIDLGS